MKKLVALVLAALLVVSMAAAAFADPATTGSIKITGTTEGHQFEAYQLLSGTVTDTTGEKLLTEINWGKGLSVEGIAALQDAYMDAANWATTRLDGLTSLQLRQRIADNFPAAYMRIHDQDIPVAVSGGNSVTIENLEPGYYMILDCPEIQEVKDRPGEAFSDYILRVVGAGDVVTVDLKAEQKIAYPTLNKKVQENSSTGVSYKIGDITYENYNDSADYSIGDVIHYVLDGTLPSNFANYSPANGGNGYFYEFQDTMSAGLTYVSQSLHVYAVNGSTKTEINDNFTSSASGQNIKVTFENLFAITEHVDASTHIVVEYDAMLNESAQLGVNGNPNTAFVSYSNNPRKIGSSQTGKTPEDQNIVYTYSLDITKQNSQVNSDNQHTKLAGAKFTLNKATAVENPPQNAKISEKFVVGAAVYVKQVSEGSYVVCKQSDTGATTELVSGAGGKLIVKGLDEGVYLMEETEAPTGYTKLTEPIAIRISSEINHNTKYTGSNSKNILTNLSIAAENSAAVADNTKNYADTGVLPMTVNNTSSSQLPTTGGMGTTLFYTIGALLMVSSAILLITKKRMSRR